MKLRLIVLAGWLLAVCSGIQAGAQDAAVMQLCHGTLNIVRVSDIQPGKMTAFIAAVKPQQAWYKAAGTSDVITLMRVIDTGGPPNLARVSETQALTTHTEETGTRRPAPDAAFADFVDKYKDSSTVKQQYVTCLTKP